MQNKKDFEEHLRAAGTEYGCDKVVPHNYHFFYANHFLDYVDRPFKLLEIGVGGEGREVGGASLRLWAEVFPLAEIYGLDIYDCPYIRYTGYYFRRTDNRMVYSVRD